MPDTYRILVLSDLHAIRDGNALRTTASMNYAQNAGPRGLLTLCLSAMREFSDQKIDLVLVAGDMTDKADGGPLSDVWTDLHWLAGQLGAPLVATSGNHDYDSRATQDPMPTKSLMSLEPPFPFGSEDDRNKYFAEQHAIYSDERVLVVTANSAAHHGYVVDGSEEHEHGRYTSLLPKLLHRSLEKIDPKPPIRIFLTHHHLNQLPTFDADERSFSIGHEDVVRTLLDHGDWFVVHGHKHRGWIQYASGPGDAPPLISASSFSADFGAGSFAEKVRHQFHVIEVSTDVEPLEGVPGSRGEIYSWTHSELGWAPSKSSEDLPGYTGFGWKASVSALARRVREQLEQDQTLSGSELLNLEPRLRFLTFDDQRRLLNILSSQVPPVKCAVDPAGRILEVSLMRVA